MLNVEILNVFGFPATGYWSSTDAHTRFSQSSRIGENSCESIKIEFNQTLSFQTLLLKIHKHTITTR
jgi:hypothetical protein